MDESDENSIVKWGEMGASAHRTSKRLAIGGKPPYLTVMTKELLRDAYVSAGTLPPIEVVALLRPSNFTRSSASNDLDQKTILRDNYDMPGY
ncbi:hypothetical protein BVRB_2g026690 [Beta vulgaris subsp. vulgaris]|nr:hypothetical protein BVRB_2g026690 [Beta vulgaris subsp. vulgaris]